MSFFDICAGMIGLTASFWVLKLGVLYSGPLVGVIFGISFGIVAFTFVSFIIMYAGRKMGFAHD